MLETGLRATTLKSSENTKIMKSTHCCCPTNREQKKISPLLCEYTCRLLSYREQIHLTSDPLRHLLAAVLILYPIIWYGMHVHSYIPGVPGISCTRSMWCHTYAFFELENKYVIGRVKTSFDLIILVLLDPAVSQKAVKPRSRTRTPTY